MATDEAFQWLHLWEGSCDYSAESSGWKWLSESDKDGVTMSIHCREVSGQKAGLLEFLSRGYLPIDWDVFFAMLMDGDYRKEWDTTAVDCLELSSHDSGLAGALGPASIVLRTFRLPYPVGLREYAQRMTAHEELDTAQRPFRCVSIESLSAEEGLRWRAIAPGASRVADMQMQMVFAPAAAPSGAGSRGLRFACRYFEDPEMWVPQWALKAATLRSLPVSMSQQVEASKKYPRESLERMLGRYVGVPRSCSHSRLRASDQEWVDCRGHGNKDEQAFSTPSTRGLGDLRSASEGALSFHSCDSDLFDFGLAFGGNAPAARDVFAADHHVAQNCLCLRQCWLRIRRLFRRPVGLLSAEHNLPSTT
eukprot:TRINITY_DN16520_c0_g4_i1.p1 TRINITY_DN16520_c0_g4~~TRINITY_DN16520_c0_g4_i1.p1  ORF type:complete len:376 (-),score=44.38 TRINITY_DN16520_c0_g4_i1:156-1247(-)